MAYLCIPNWDEFQHYKDRSPPWIKLHNQLLEDYEFECMPDASKAHLLCIWLLASRTGNKIKADSEWIGRKIGATDPVDIDIMIRSGFLQLNQEDGDRLQDASKALQEVEQNACLEGEREQSRAEGEESKSEVEKPKKSGFKKPTIEEINSYLMEKGINDFQYAEKIWHFYESKGWVVGKAKMKSWKSAISSNWIQSYTTSKQGNGFHGGDKFDMSNEQGGLI
jgi:hypothetical protein